MTSRCTLNCSCRHCACAHPSRPMQLASGGMRSADNEDVGSVRLSRIEAAMKETRADRAGIDTRSCSVLAQADCRWRAGSPTAASVRVADSRNAPPFAAQLRREFRRSSCIPVRFARRASRGRPHRHQPRRAAGRAAGPRCSGTRDRCRRRYRIVRQGPGRVSGNRVIAITGSNGKSTVTEMVGAMVRTAKVRRWWQETSACRYWKP